MVTFIIVAVAIALAILNTMSACAGGACLAAYPRFALWYVRRVVQGESRTARGGALEEARAAVVDCRGEWRRR